MRSSSLCWLICEAFNQLGIRSRLNDRINCGITTGVAIPGWFDDFDRLDGAGIAMTGRHELSIALLHGTVTAHMQHDIKCKSEHNSKIYVLLADLVRTRRMIRPMVDDDRIEKDR
jgi:hypothetical protein